MKKNIRKILVIITRRIGDVLLGTPLIRSLRKAYPEASVHVLVFDHTADILNGNPDIDEVIPITADPSFVESWKVGCKIRNKYDLALSTQASDRPVFYAFLAARIRVAVLAPTAMGNLWKRWLMTRSAALDNQTTHTVLQNLQLADLIDVPRCYEVVVPGKAHDAQVLERLLPFAWDQTQYCLLHVSPKFRYKYWSEKGWRELIAFLTGKGLKVVLTGSAEKDELKYIQEVIAGVEREVINLSGKLEFSQVALLAREACLYVGTDTAITHLAAATGTPTVTLFGPSNPVKWGPWPKGFSQNKNPFVLRQALQQVDNVLLLQGVNSCVPCLSEGCEQHINSASQCLQEMPSSRVIAAAEQMLQFA